MQSLTDRQAEVLRLIAEGRSNQGIARVLGISENGVKGHVSRLLQKFDVQTRAALIAAAGATSNAPSGSDVLRVLRVSLQDVVGATATAALLARACKHAGVHPDALREGRALAPDTTAAIVAALWPLLIEATGQVLINRLRQRGFESGGRVDPKEVAAWLQTNDRR